MSLRLALAAAVALAACNKDDTPEIQRMPPPPLAPKLPAFPGPGGTFGGGYKEAKFGMTPELVEMIFGKPVTRGTDEVLGAAQPFEVFALQDDGAASKRELAVHFYDGKFMRAVLYPNFTDTFAAGLDSLRAALVKKYGPPKDEKTTDKQYGAFWSDGVTGIKLYIVLGDEGVMAAKGLKDKRIPSSAQVIYEHIEAVKAVEAAIAAKAQPAAPPATPTPVPTTK